MEKELIDFIIQNKLSPFNSYKTPMNNKNDSIFKTKDGKSVHTRVLSKIASNFSFADTSNLLNLFDFTDNINEIRKRQEFFKKISKNLENNFLKDLKKPKSNWGPKYDIMVVTDNEKTFSQLKNLDVPIKFLLNEDDVLDLESCDIVQVVDVDQFNNVLEQLPQSVFLDSIEEVYLERYLEILSGWDSNFRILKNIDNMEVNEIINELNPLLSIIIADDYNKKITRNEVELELERINEEISEKVKELNISGDKIFEILSKNKIPEELEKIINSSIKKASVPEHLFETKIPVKINEQELENFFKLQDASQNTKFSDKIKKNSDLLKKIPEKLERLSNLILLYDFISGVSKFKGGLENFPEHSDEFKIENAKNIFLNNPSPVSFYLHDKQRCSILTGANSGGKTTLIEHIIQIISLFNIGLAVNGNVKIPIFSEVYYFAKNKGSASKGAFETLLTQMSKISPGKNTLILADEIEAVTEPGVAGKIISATAQYFIDKNCFLIIATHLGYEIEKVLPNYARIDGIEAKGLSEDNELIVDHNPVLGRLANSTPELIVEKLANSEDHDYFVYLHNYLKNNGKN